MGMFSLLSVTVIEECQLNEGRINSKIVCTEDKVYVRKDFWYHETSSKKK
jgi:hypothetical protein